MHPKTTISVGPGFAGRMRVRRMSGLALLFALAAGSAGCGQKGPLTLPKPAGAASAPALAPR
jgi:predicted small lipoprotein YifL